MISRFKFFQLLLSLLLILSFIPTSLTLINLNFTVWNFMIKITRFKGIYLFVPFLYSQLFVLMISDMQIFGLKGTIYINIIKTNANDNNMRSKNYLIIYFIKTISGIVLDIIKNKNVAVTFTNVCLYSLIILLSKHISISLSVSFIEYILSLPKTLLLQIKFLKDCFLR